MPTDNLNPRRLTRREFLRLSAALTGSLLLTACGTPATPPPPTPAPATATLTPQPSQTPLPTATPTATLIPTLTPTPTPDPGPEIPEWTKALSKDGKGFTLALDSKTGVWQLKDEKGRAIFDYANFDGLEGFVPSLGNITKPNSLEECTIITPKIKELAIRFDKYLEAKMLKLHPEWWGTGTARKAGEKMTVPAGTAEAGNFIEMEFSVPDMLVGRYGDDEVVYYMPMKHEIGNRLIPVRTSPKAETWRESKGAAMADYKVARNLGQLAVGGPYTVKGRVYGTINSKEPVFGEWAKDMSSDGMAYYYGFLRQDLLHNEEGRAGVRQFIDNNMFFAILCVTSRKSVFNRLFDKVASLIAPRA